MRFGETITRLQAGVKVDPYSLAQAPDWDNPAQTLIEGCVVYPRGQVGTENTATGRDQIARQTLTVLLPPGAQLNPRDRVIYRDAQFEVIGFQFEFRNPFTGWTPGTQTTIERIEG